MTTRPFLGGEYVSFSKAFPHIGPFRIEIDQGDAVWGEAAASHRSAVYTETNPPPAEIHCTNRLCQQGGLALQGLIPGPGDTFPYDYDKKFRCKGHEDSPKGRNQGRSCMNYFHLRMHIEPKTT